MRQRAQSLLDWVTLNHHEDGTRVEIKPTAGLDGTLFGSYDLILESYDQNSRLAIPSVLRTDTILITILRPEKCFEPPQSSLTFTKEIQVYREYEPTVYFPADVFTAGSHSLTDYDCQGLF